MLCELRRLESGSISDKIADFVWKITVGKTFHSLRQGIRHIFFETPVDCMTDRMKFLAGKVFNEQVVLSAMNTGLKHLENGEDTTALLRA